jgi:hypothetical protein
MSALVKPEYQTFAPDIAAQQRFLAPPRKKINPFL